MLVTRGEKGSALTWLELDGNFNYLQSEIEAIPQGQKGDTGSKGDKGDKGDSGDRGLKGDTGSKGDKGDKGDTGAKGDTGSQGAQGLQGIQGVQGLPGPQGNNTVLAYILENSAVSNSTTPVNITSFVLAANSNYIVDVMLRVGSDTASGLRIGWATPVGSTKYVDVQGMTNATNTFAASFMNSDQLLSQVFCTANYNAAWIRMRGMVKTVGSGNLTFTIAANAAGTNASCFNVSTFILTRI